MQSQEGSTVAGLPDRQAVLAAAATLLVAYTNCSLIGVKSRRAAYRAASSDVYCWQCLVPHAACTVWLRPLHSANSLDSCGIQQPNACNKQQSNACSIQQSNACRSRISFFVFCLGYHVHQKPHKISSSQGWGHHLGCSCWWCCSSSARADHPADHLCCWERWMGYRPAHKTTFATVWAD